MPNEERLEAVHDSLIEPPVDYFELEDWQGGEIYRGESYLEMSNGDYVLNEKDNVIEYVAEHYNELIDLLDPIFKTAGEE